MNIAQIPKIFMILLGLAPAGFAAEDHSVADLFSDTLRTGGNGPQMVVIPSGRFVLGGLPVSEGELGLVRIDQTLAFGVTEITRGQFRYYLKATQSGDLDQLPAGGDDLPVTSVSWDDAEAYVGWLSRETGQRYRLPSASEWEYAARAATTTNYYWGDSVGENLANCLNCGAGYEGRLAPVKTFPPNAWGLYDMHGNVWEWTRDCIDPNTAPPADGSPMLLGNCDSRELRGGSAQSDAWSIRAGARAFGLRKMRDDDVGFRVVRDIR